MPRDELTAAQVREMFELLAQHFDGVTQAQFAHDLAEKNRVILLTRDERLVGFSTLLASTTAFEDEIIHMIYSGDTIVAPEAWGTTTLSRAWISAVNGWRAELPEGRCFWLLLTSGFRTYRFLPVFWREFFPRFDRATPPEQQRLLNYLASEQFGLQFDSQRGLVRFQNPQRLRAGLNQIPAGRANDPHIAFFAARNPGHADGDELACLTELCPENLTAAGRRMTTPQTCAPHCDHR
ncbi:MAG: GNAT family N-acetyltransferase [Pedosphaera sp.]|nr:GNAT family N-acetyltransferase [Pedosphaera sp.]